MEFLVELRLSDIAKSSLWNRKKHKTKPSCPSSYHTFKPLFCFFFFPPQVSSSQLWKTSMYINSCDLLCSSAGQKLICWLSAHSKDILNGHLLQQSFLSTKMSSIHAFSIISLSFSQFTARSLHKTALIFSSSLKLNQNWKTEWNHTNIHFWLN